MWHARALRFAADHPAAAGHFPGNPIIPGALMLDFVVAAIAGENNDDPVLIQSVKFLQPVRPGARIDLQWQTEAGGAIRFECRQAGETALAMTGVFKIDPDSI